MDDKTGALEKLKAIMAKAEQVDMSSVKIGDIIYVPLDEEDGLILKDGYKDRNKYIVIIGFTPEGVAIGALLINSEIDSSKRSEELLDCQYPLMVRNYRDILDYDSWLDCSDIFELSKLKITEKNGKLKGCLISEDREKGKLCKDVVFRYELMQNELGMAEDVVVDDSVIDTLRQVYVKKLRDSGFKGRISTYYR